MTFVQRSVVPSFVALVAGLGCGRSSDSTTADKANPAPDAAVAPGVAVHFNDKVLYGLRKPGGPVKWIKEQRSGFGITCTQLPDPEKQDPGKRLCYSGNTVLNQDGYEYIFGDSFGGASIVKENGKPLKQVPVPGKNEKLAWRTVWETRGPVVRVTETVEIVRGEQGAHDAVLVTYQLVNRDKESIPVGLRFMLDAHVGSNPGAPFRLPAAKGKPARIVDKMEVLKGADVPDVIEVLEDPDDAKATAARASLRLQGFEAPEKVVLCRYPDQGHRARWGGAGEIGSWDYQPIDRDKDRKDSCLLVYWAISPLKGSGERTLAFAYGLERVR